MTNPKERAKNTSRLSWRIQERRNSIIFLIPTVAILLLTSVFPLLYSLYLSAFRYNMLMPGMKPRFIGFLNYIEIFQEPYFLNSLRRSVIYVASAVSIEFVIGLGLALVITAKIKGLMFIRVALLVPLMITPVVAGVLWRFLFNPEYGVVNFIIQIFGGDMVTWLARPNTAFASIVIVEVWQQLPVVIFILAAGISSLPETIYESAMIDGASSLQKFRYITLPLLKSVIAVVLLLRIMDAFKIFDVIYTLTYGGPGKSTEVVSLFVYKQGLKYFQIGSATAMSWVFLILVLIISLFFMRRVLKEPG